MNRRTFLQATGTAVTVALAGCIGDNEESTESSTSLDSELRTPIMEFVAAFNNENKQAVLDAYHPNSTYVPDRDNIYFRYTWSVTDMTLVERSSSSAVVQADITLTDDTGDTEQVVHTYELRPNAGEWDIYIFVVGTEIPDTGTATADSG